MMVEIGRDRYRDRDRDCERNDRRYRSSEKERSFDERSKVKNECFDDDDDIQEVSRSGNFEYWRTASVKVSRDDPEEDRHRRHSSNLTGVQQHETSSGAGSMTSLEEDIKRLHQRVAKNVMDNMNRYYKGTDEFDPSLQKIGSPQEYSDIARKLSHDLRNKIKESYEAGSLEGIVLTSDHMATIQTEVERYFEGLPVI